MNDFELSLTMIEELSFKAVRSSWKDLLPDLMPTGIKKPEIGWKSALLVAGGAYMTYRFGVVSKAIGVCCKVMPVIRVIATACGRKPPVVYEYPGTIKSTFESMRAGSTEQKMPIPEGQSMIGYMESGTFHAVGAAIRIHDWLVLPAHVYASADEPVVQGKQSWISLSGYETQAIDTDLIAIKLSGKDWSTVGVSVPTIAHSIGKRGAYVSITGVTGCGTTGTLRHDTSVFGRLIYTGSTVPGYSGCAYMAGKQVMGVHTNGGAVNGGYSASYVLSMVNHFDKIRPEDSEDWLKDRNDDEELLLDPTWGDTETIRIFFKGRYAIVQRKTMNSVYGTGWDTRGRSYGDYDDHYESIPKNLQQGSGGLKSMIQDLPEISPELTDLMRLLTKQSKTRLRTIRKILLSEEVTASPVSKETVL